MFRDSSKMSCSGNFSKICLQDTQNDPYGNHREFLLRILSKFPARNSSDVPKSKVSLHFFCRNLVNFTRFFQYIHVLPKFSQVISFFFFFTNSTQSFYRDSLEILLKKIPRCFSKILSGNFFPSSTNSTQSF